MDKHNLFFFTVFLRKLPYIEQLLFFLTITFIPTQIGKHYWPDFASIFSIRTDYFAPVIYVWDILFLFLLAAFFLQGKRFRPLPILLLLTFLLSQLFSLISAENIGAGLVRFEQLSLIGLFGVYIASSSFAFLKRGLFWGLFVGVFYSSAIGVLQVMKGGTLGLWILGERSFNLSTLSIATFDWYGQVFLRAYATFPHPNVFGAFLLIALGLCFFVYEKSSESKRYKEVFWGGILIGSMALFLTFSRVVFGLYALFFSYLLRFHWKLLLVIFLLLLPFLYVRYHSAFNFDQLSFIRREELAVQSLEMFFSNPLFGVGLNNFITVLAYGDIVSGENRFLQPVHNIFLLLLSETGFIGLLGFMLFISSAIATLLRDFRRQALLIFLWISILIMGMFDHYLLTLAQGQRILFLVWGISMLDYTGERTSTKNRQSNRMATAGKIN